MPLTAWDFVKTNEDSFMEIYCASAKTSVDSKKDSDRPISRFMLDEVTSCPFGREQMIRHTLRCAVPGSDKSFAHLVLNRRYVIHGGVRYVASVFFASNWQRSVKDHHQNVYDAINDMPYIKKRKTFAYPAFLPLKNII